MVAESGRTLGGSDDIGEEHRREDAIDLLFAPCAGEELLNQIHGLVLIAGASAQMKVTGELHEGGVCDVLGCVATRLDRRYVIAASMYHESRGADGGEYRSDIHLEVHFQKLASRPGAGGEALEATCLLLSVLV